MGQDDRSLKTLEKDVSPLRGLRSRMFGLPFTLVCEATRWDIAGQDKLIAAVEEHQRTGRGLITVSNHVSLFDDPLVLLALLNIRRPSENSKCWYSTACADNFNPKGKSIGARVTRYFSEVANIVFLSRSHKRGDGALATDPVQDLMDRLDDRLEEMVEHRAASLGLDVESYVKTFLTSWGRGMDPARVQTYNQPGLLESCVRVDAGDWVHFFPEGGRSRDIHLRTARPGVGKVLYHGADARVIPLCFYGTQDIMPVGGRFPLPGKTVHVAVGDPIDPARLNRLRRGPDGIQSYQALSNLAMEHVAELRPDVLNRYLGPEAATRVLVEEAQMQRAMQPTSESEKAEQVGVATPARAAAGNHPTRRAN